MHEKSDMNSRFALSVPLNEEIEGYVGKKVEIRPIPGAGLLGGEHYFDVPVYHMNETLLRTDKGPYQIYRMLAEGSRNTGCFALFDGKNEVMISDRRV